MEFLQVAAGAKELPTVETAEHLKSIGYSSNIDPAKVVPGVFTRQSPNPTLAELLDSSFNAIQQARRDTTNLRGIQNLIDLAADSLDSCVEMRRADQSDALIKDLKAGVRCALALPSLIANRTARVLTLDVAADGIIRFRRQQVHRRILEPET